MNIEKKENGKELTIILSTLLEVIQKTIYTMYIVAFYRL